MSLMVRSAKFVAIGVGLLLSINALAADAIVGKWQTYEDGQAKAVVEISPSGNTFKGVIISGNTEKAKQYVGRQVITGLKADGSGKYSDGKITDPVKNKSYSLAATLNGNTLNLRGYIGLKFAGRTQTWKRVQ